MLNPAHVPSAALSVLGMAYASILLAELVGDKSVYTIATLSLRFRLWAVFAGLTLAFMGKMFAAVLFGNMLLRLSGRLTGLLSALCFFACALFIWFRETGDSSPPAAQETRWLSSAAISFSALFFTEWCDTGQIAAAALAAHTQAPTSVWLGGTLALITKGTLAMLLGTKLSARVPARLIRTIACASYCVLGMLSLARQSIP